MKIRQEVLNLRSGHKNVNTQRAITPQAEKPELQFMCSAQSHGVYHLCEVSLICRAVLNLWSGNENC